MSAQIAPLIGGCIHGNDSNVGYSIQKSNGSVSSSKSMLPYSEVSIEGPKMCTDFNPEIKEAVTAILYFLTTRTRENSGQV